MEKPQERLNKFLKYLGITKTELARKLGMRPDSLWQYLDVKKNTVIGAKYREALKQSGLNYDWYTTGEGDMLLESDNKIQEPLIPVAPDVINTLAGIRVYELPAHCLIGNNVNYTDLPSTYATIQIMGTLNIKTDVVFRASGSSMSDSGITDGDYIVVNTAAEPSSGKLIVGIHNDLVIVKRYKSLPDGKFALYSENGGEHPYPLHDHDVFKRIGVVLWIIKHA